MLALCAPLPYNHALMRESTEPTVPKWAFFFGDAVLLGGAYFIFRQSNLPMGVWAMAFVVVCVAGGAWLGIMPFLLEYRLRVKLAELKALTSAADQLKNLEAIADRISGATARWNNVHDEAEKVATTAKGIAERMGAEVQSFTQFMQKINDGEKATLRLESEKLKRAEGDWLQVLVRMLDHVYALNRGAAQSGQPKLIEQMMQFQGACRDSARRVGLVPFVANPAEPFDSQRHQAWEGDGPAEPGATVAETVATGYTYQGKLLRPALVRLTREPVGEPETAGSALPEAAGEPAQSQLAFDKAGA